MEKLKLAGIEVMWHGKKHNEGSHYCAQCDVSCQLRYKPGTCQTNVIHSDEGLTLETSVFESFTVILSTLWLII